MAFDKVTQLYMHPDVKNLGVPGAGLFVYNKQKHSLRMQQGTEFDPENDTIIFACQDEQVVQVFELGFGIGSHYQEYYTKNKSKLILL